MPIIDADIPIIDNQIDFKIDNPIERVYLYRVTSAPVVTPDVRGLRFYKRNQKFNGLDTFISEDGNYYISAYRSAPNSNSGYWLIARTIGEASSAINRFNSTFNVNFFLNPPSPVQNYSNVAGSVVLSRITTDVISQ